MWRRLLRGKRGSGGERQKPDDERNILSPRNVELNDISVLTGAEWHRRGETLTGPGNIRILDPSMRSEYNRILEEARSREEELFSHFVKSLNSKFCIKLVRDEIFLSHFTLLGTPVIKADNISLRLLAAILVLMSERDKSGKFLGIMKTGEGEVRAYRDGNSRVSGLSITGRDLGGDCVNQVRALSKLRGKAIIYRSEDHL